MSDITVTGGRPFPMGATVTEDGVNFAVFSAHADRVTLCLFDEDGREDLVIDLPEREGDIWHGHVAGVGVGQTYGFRARGRYVPEEGHRFNPHKLLLDPYAKALTGLPVWDDALMGYEVGAGDLTLDPRDSAAFMPRGIVVDERFDWEGDRLLRRPAAETVFYEGHVKGLTAQHPEVSEGGFAGLASDAMIAHYTRLGITALELLPVQTFITDRFLEERGLVNYWGYQTLGFFAPHPAYGTMRDFQQMVKRLHAAGIEVILDVVYNHTAEGNELGPTLSFRGLDNASYYKLDAVNARHYVNDTGTGNTLDLTQPMVLRMVLDSLRYWVEVGHVDGFRFDLASVLGREQGGFDPGGGFFRAVRQDPVLAGVKLIAEPWDIGPGGYQLGSYPPPFMEWNDRYRDGVRRFWRGDAGRAPDMAARLAGSAGEFDHSGRLATSSVNMLTAHDGFTLADVVSYKRRHNFDNGEDGRDGHGENYSDNMGQEGPSEELAGARAARRRAMMATLLLSQGVPLILAGDEIGNSQGGNNNAYNQDNATGWIDWDGADWDFFDWTRRMIAFRKAHPALRQVRFLHSRERLVDGTPDLFWHKADGSPIQPGDWSDEALRLVIAEVRTASGTPEYVDRDGALLLMLNAGAAEEIAMPETPEGTIWCREIDSADPGAEIRPAGASETVAAGSVTVFVLQPSPSEETTP